MPIRLKRELICERKLDDGWSGFVSFYSQEPRRLIAESVIFLISTLFIKYQLGLVAATTWMQPYCLLPYLIPILSGFKPNMCETEITMGKSCKITTFCTRDAITFEDCN